MIQTTIFTVLGTAVLSHMLTKHYCNQIFRSDLRIFELKRMKEQKRLEVYYNSHHRTSVIKYRRKDPSLSFRNDPKYKGTLFRLVAYDDPYTFRIINEGESVEKVKDELREQGHTECEYIEKKWMSTEEIDKPKCNL